MTSAVIAAAPATKAPAPAMTLIRLAGLASPGAIRVGAAGSSAAASLSAGLVLARRARGPVAGACAEAGRWRARQPGQARRPGGRPPVRRQERARPSAARSASAKSPQVVEPVGRRLRERPGEHVIRLARGSPGRMARRWRRRRGQAARTPPPGPDHAGTAACRSAAQRPRTPARTGRPGRPPAGPLAVPGICSPVFR